MGTFEKFINEVHAKKNTSTCSVQEIRLPIFAPIKRYTPSSAIYKNFTKNKMKKITTTQWGTIAIKGFLLTQIHKDILDLITICANKITPTDDKRLAVEFSINEVLRNYTGATSNHKWFKNLLEEIMSTTISVKFSDETIYYFHIISAMKYNEKGDFAGIYLSREYIEFYQKTLAVNYNKLIKDIVDIESSLIKSIIRFFLSHNEINIGLVGLLEALGMEVDVKSRYFRKIRQEIKDNTFLLEQFDIRFNSVRENFKFKGLVHDKLFFIR